MMIRRTRRFRHFIVLASVSFVTLLGGSTTLFVVLLAPEERFFFNLAGAIVVSWTTILTLYYIWAIYFYNINRGWTEKEWEQHHKLAAAKGEPSGNPNSEETLGLPPGTVRGTLALSVMVAGLAMMIASLGMPATMKESEMMIDHIEFLKTAFIMVIAFYFGSKSLEILRNSSPRRRPPLQEGAHLTPWPPLHKDGEGEGTSTSGQDDSSEEKFGIQPEQ